MTASDAMHDGRIHSRPKDYLCYHARTGKTDEIVFTFAALDPTATNPPRSQTNAYYVKG